jgi:hypothetical protein
MPARWGDIAVLVAGEGDYVPCVRQLQGRGLPSGFCSGATQSARSCVRALVLIAEKSFLDMMSRSISASDPETLMYVSFMPAKRRTRGVLGSR